MQSTYIRHGAVALMLVAAAPAAATLKVATYTGTVSGGIDTYGLFGTKGADLTGFTYIATIRYDPAVGALFRQPGSELLYSGAENHFPDARMTASININGRNRAIPTTKDYILAYTNRRTGQFELQFDSGYTVTGRETQLFFSSIHSAGPATLHDNLPTSEQFAYRSQSFYANYFIAVDLDHGDLLSREDIDLGPRNFLTITDVPEPATWTLMIAGFGLTGAAMRRRVSCTSAPPTTGRSRASRR